MSTTNLGRVCFVPKGVYSASKAYKRLDVVTSNGDTYVAIADSTGAALTDTSKWQIIIDNSAITEPKVDKVTTAKENNITVFNSAGGIKDSGKKVSDFATAAQGTKADNAATKTDFTNHTGNKSNPHAVTREQIGAASAQEVSDARGIYSTLKERLENIEGEALTHRYGILWDKTNATCTRLYDAVGLTANAHKGTFNSSQVNDFDSRYPWSGRKLCNVDLDEYRRIQEKNGDIRDAIVAWEGDVDFALDGSNGFVGVYTPEFWARQEETDAGVTVIVADQELPGYIHFPFSIGGRYFACSDGNGGITSKAGAYPLSSTMSDKNYTLGTLHSLATSGGMTLDDVFTWSADTVQLAVEFATLNSQAAVGDGVSSLYRQDASDLPLEAGTGNSVIVPVACANVAIPGAIIDFGTSTGQAQIARRVVVSVNTYSANSSYKEIVFDGDPVTYTTSTIVQIHGLTNTEDAQIGSASGYIGTNGKSHAYYRGRIAHANMFRYVLGAYRQKDTGHLWYAKDRAQAAAYDALDTTVHVDSGYALPYKDDGTTQAEGYVQSIGTVRKLPLIPFCTAVGGSSANPIGDYCWHPSKSSGNTILLAGGHANNGSHGGRFYGYWHHASGLSSWACAALPFLK